MQSFQLISPHPANGIVAPVGYSSVNRPSPILIRSLGARKRLCRHPSTTRKTWVKQRIGSQREPSEGLVHRPLRNCTGPCRHRNGRPGRCDLGTRGTGSQRTVHRIGGAKLDDDNDESILAVSSVWSQKNTKSFMPARKLVKERRGSLRSPPFSEEG